MIVTYNNQDFACATAYRGSDYVRLVDSTGFVVATFEGVKNFSSFTLIDGEWTDVPEVSECNLVTMSPDGLLKSSSKRVCDVPSVSLITVTLYEDDSSKGNYANFPDVMSYSWSDVSYVGSDEMAIFIPVSYGGPNPHRVDYRNFGVQKHPSYYRTLLIHYNGEAITQWQTDSNGKRYITLMLLGITYSSTGTGSSK